LPFLVPVVGATLVMSFEESLGLSLRRLLQILFCW
jgi:hypothetical protein